jgi:hypothetical protein
MKNRIVVQGTSVEDIRDKVFAEHGAGARLTGFERVTQGGIRGFMSKQFYEATVLLPIHPGINPDTGMDISDRLGIAALLAGADEVEDEFITATRIPEFSTGSNEFDELIAELSARNIVDVKPQVVEVSTLPELLVAGAPQEFLDRQRSVPPVVAVRPGDLVVVVSLGHDALGVAQTMSKHNGNTEVRGGGLIKARGTENLVSRRSALLARADNVDAGKSLICAFGLDGSPSDIDTVESLGADQVWVVVDASRKIEDTRRVMAQIRSKISVHALAVVNTAYTSTPETVNSLDISVGWADGLPSVSSRL